MSVFCLLLFTVVLFRLVKHAVPCFLKVDVF